MSNWLNKTKILTIIILFSIFILFNQCLAQGLPNLTDSQDIMEQASGREGIGYNTEQELEATIGSIIRIALSLLGVFFLMYHYHLHTLLALLRQCHYRSQTHL